MNDAPDKKQSWWSRLSGGLKRTSASIGTAIADLVVRRKLDRAMVEEIEDVLLRADLGVDVAARISAAVGHGRYDKAISADEVKAIVAEEVEKTLATVAKPLRGRRRAQAFCYPCHRRQRFRQDHHHRQARRKVLGRGRKVMLAAGDTFRAAAIEQLKIWGTRTSSPVIAREHGADAAGLAFDALTAAKAEGVDVLLIDTAGRLQNRAELMSELEKSSASSRRSILTRRMRCSWCSTRPWARTHCRRSRCFIAPPASRVWS